VFEGVPGGEGGSEGAPPSGGDVAVFWMGGGGVVSVGVIWGKVCVVVVGGGDGNVGCGGGDGGG
jgi:hypothetical protein